MDQLILFSNMSLTALRERDCHSILALNEKTAQRGLVLTPEQALETAEVKSRALKLNSRFEIGVGGLGKLIERFSKSTFATPEDWHSLIVSLCELFYFVKTETEDKISDNELIDFMFDRFENQCGGSLEMLGPQCEGLIARTNGVDFDDCTDFTVSDIDY